MSDRPAPKLAPQLAPNPGTHPAPNLASQPAPHSAPNLAPHSVPNADAALLPLMLVYGAAGLLHFMHNAVYLHDYPNLPAWLTAGGVVAAWLLVAGVGVLGYLLYSRGSRVAGLIVIAAYAVLGFGGLDHYTVAPVAAHTVAMNLTILLEAATAAVLLIFVARCALSLVVRRVKLRG
jgi:hypothetical protein